MDVRHLLPSSGPITQEYAHRIAAGDCADGGIQAREVGGALGEAGTTELRQDGGRLS